MATKKKSKKKMTGYLIQVYLAHKKAWQTAYGPIWTKPLVNQKVKYLKKYFKKVKLKKITSR